jgi:IS30 family transposase
MARYNGPPTVSSQPTRINERKEQRHYEGYQLWGGHRMSELTTFNEGSALARDARRFGREISRGRLGTQIRTSQVDNATDVTLAKVENLTMATGNAMQQITRVAQAQRQLEMIAPDAAGRLAFIADDHMLGCAELLSDLRRDLRRIR